MAKRKTADEYLNEGGGGGGGKKTARRGSTITPAEKKKGIVAEAGVRFPATKRPGRTALGVGNRYTTVLPTPYGDVKAHPRYFTGDEFKPAGWSFDRRYSLAQELLEMGLITAKQAEGDWNPSVRGAYSGILKAANYKGVPWRELMDGELAQIRQMPEDQRPGAGEGAGAQRKAPVAQVTNPTDIRAVIDKAATDLYGGAIGQGEMDSIISSFQNLESSRNAQLEQAALADQGGQQIMDLPGLDSYVAEQIRAAHPNEVKAKAFGDRLDTLLRTMTTSGV